jgi:tyrosyl-tRNA synthetase
MVPAHLQRAGIRPIAVVGGGTGMIGDPSGRASVRPMLTVAEIDRNLAGISQQFAPYLDFEGGRVLLVNNAEWLFRHALDSSRACSRGR